MKDTSREGRWRRLVWEQERSGQSVREFAASRGLSAWSLYGWRSRLGAGRPKKRDLPRCRRASEEAGRDFVAVEIIGAPGGEPAAEVAAGFEVAIGEVRIRVPRGFDPAELARLVSAVRSAC